MDLLIKGNERFATAPYTPPPTLKETLPNLKKTFIITCMDPRVIPEQFMDFKSGEFAVVRNAGGRVAHVTSEIAFASAASDLTDILIVHHTDCGVSNMKNAMIRKRLADKGLGDASTAEWDFGEINDLDQSVKDDVATLRDSPYVSATTNVRGFVLDLMESGKLREVESRMGSKL